MSVVHRSGPLCSSCRRLGSSVQGEEALGLTPGLEAPGGICRSAHTGAAGPAALEGEDCDGEGTDASSGSHSGLGYIQGGAPTHTTLGDHSLSVPHRCKVLLRTSPELGIHKEPEAGHRAEEGVEGSGPWLAAALGVQALCPLW